jgi:hypothetical protein
MMTIAISDARAMRVDAYDLYLAAIASLAFSLIM